MTLALCFNCGHTKFGAICPCNKCGVSSTGDVELDIAFSDHHISPGTIAAFGRVIEAIQPLDDDPSVRFWVFMSYITDKHGDILSAEPPPELANQVHDIYQHAQLPDVTVQPTGIPRPDPGPETELAVPQHLFEAYKQHYEVYSGLAMVEARTLDGRIHRRALLRDAPSGPILILAGDHPNLTPSDLAALREVRGCLFSLRKRPWAS